MCLILGQVTLAYMYHNFISNALTVALTFCHLLSRVLYECREEKARANFFDGVHVEGWVALNEKTLS